MHEDLGMVAQLAFWAALLLGMAVGGAIGAWKGFHVGGATAGLIIGVIGVAAAGYVLHAYWRFWREPNAVEATVVSAETPKGAKLPALTVRFTTRDGRTIETSDTGSPPDTAFGIPDPGQTIGVRYGPDPSKVTLHVVRGWLIGGTVFGMFSAFALLVGLFFLAQIADERSRAHPPAAVQEAPAAAGTRALVAKGITVVSNVAFVAAFAWMVLGRGGALPAFGVGLRVIAVAGIGYAVAGLLTPGGPWTSVMIPLIVGIISGLFSVFIRIVS